MFCALRALIGSTSIFAGFACLACVVAAFWQAPAMAAGKVVVEQFDGSGASAFREQVKKTLKDLDVDVVTDKKLAATEADLGLMQASDSYSAVSKQLGATNFVRGTVKGKNPVATLVVKDKDGKKVGQKTFKGKNSAQLMATLSKQLKGALSGLLKGGGGAVATESKDEGAAEGDAQEAKQDKQGKKEEKKEQQKAAAAAKQERQEKQKPEPVAAADEEDEDEAEEKEDGTDAAIKATAKADDGPAEDNAGREWKGLDVSLGTLIYSRNFEYNATKKGDQQRYETNPVAPALVLALEYFITRNIGLAAGGEFTVALSSAREVGNNTATFGTSSMGFYAGPKGKIHFGSLEVNLLAAYAKHSFKLDEKVSVNNTDVFSNVPAADYSMVRGVVGARYDLGPVAVFGTFGYDHVLDMGAFTNSFPNATAAATEGSAGVVVPLTFLMSGLDVRASLVARSYGIAMNSKADDGNIAGGATDSYRGAMITAGYRTK